MKWVIGISAASAVATLATSLFLVTNSKPATATTPQNNFPVSSTCQDSDGDGYGINCQKGADCNDHDPRISPDQKEVCNFRDDDCNTLVDDAPPCAKVEYNPKPVDVSGGSFWMGNAANDGANDEHPQHQVSISGFQIDRYEVTNERYLTCVNAKVCKPPQIRSSGQRKDYFGVNEFSRYPAVFVNWEQANTFCRWDGGRLPTEAEWELAAKGLGSTKRTYPWGNDAPDCTKANFGGDGSCVGDTDLVGRRVAGASPWGAMDMAGNVWEWTSDWYDANYYSKSPNVDPRGPSQGKLKVMRGGCWMSGADSLRVSCRKAELPDTWAPNVGFRCVRKGGR